MNNSSPRQTPRRKLRSHRLVVEGLEARQLMAGLAGDEFALNSPSQSIRTSISELANDQTVIAQFDLNFSELAGTDVEFVLHLDMGDQPDADFSSVDQDLDGVGKHNDQVMIDDLILDDIGMVEEHADESVIDESVVDESVVDESVIDESVETTEPEGNGQNASPVNPGGASGRDPLSETGATESNPGIMVPEHEVEAGLTTESSPDDVPDAGASSTSFPQRSASVIPTIEGAEDDQAVASFIGLRPYVASELPTLDASPSVIHDEEDFRYFAVNESLSATSFNSLHLLKESTEVETHFAFSLLTNESVRALRTSPSTKAQLAHSIDKPKTRRAEATAGGTLAESYDAAVDDLATRDSQSLIERVELSPQPTSNRHQPVKLVGIAINKSGVVECDLGTEFVLPPQPHDPELAQSQFTFDFTGICRLEGLLFLVTFLTPVRDTFNKSRWILCDSEHETPP